MRGFEIKTEADAIAHAQRHGLALDPTLTVRPMPLDTPEGTLLAKIRMLAKQYGWLSYHTHDSRKSETGFPDLVLTDGTSVLMIELKTNGGKATADQQTWLNLLAHTGKVEAAIWRPRDWDQIAARLTRKEGSP